jgi:hypothetical protein
MKPASIRRFDLFYLGSTALSLVAYLLSYRPTVAAVEAKTAAAGMQLGQGTVISTMAIGLGVSLLLWFLVSRKGLAVAKWIIVVLFIGGLLSAFGLLGSPGLLQGSWTMLKTISALILLLEAVAVYYLFQPDAKDWFAGGAKGGGDAPAPDLPAD